MFEFLFAIFDIPLICVLIILVLSSLLFIRNIYNIFLSLFISILLVIFIASTILVQQSYLAEFIIISIFFLFAIIFFIFNLHNDYNDSHVAERNKINLKLNLAILFFLISFILIALNFYHISTTHSEYIVRNIQTSHNINIRHFRSNKQNEDMEYNENISILNQNKVFQKLTHIIMLYVCIVTILYFYNKKENKEEDEEEKDEG